MAVSCRCNSPRPGLKERGSAPGPCLPLPGLFCLGQHDQRAGQFIGVKRIRPGGNNKFAELLHLAALEATRLFP